MRYHYEGWSFTGRTQDKSRELPPSLHITRMKAMQNFSKGAQGLSV